MNKVFRFRCFLFVMIFAGFINIGHSEQFIVEDGKTKAEIVLSAKPTRAAEFGAQELQTYLEKISGARVKIVPAIR